MKGGLENKLSLQIFSVGIAIILWLIITYTENPNINVTLNNIPIEYVGVENIEKQNLTLVHPEKTPTVSLVVSGKRNDLFNVIDNVRAIADISNMTTEGTFDVSLDFDIPIKSVEILKAKMTTSVVIEQLVKKQVPISVKQIGISKEYVIKSTPEREFIEVTGASSYVTNIAYAQVIVDISDIKVDEISGYSYSFVDAENADINQSRNIRAESNGIVVSNTVYLSKTVPIEIEYPDEISQNYTVNVKNISNQYINVGVSEIYFNDITSIKARFPSQITSTDAQEYTLPLIIPDGVYAKDVLNINIKVEIVPKEVKSVTLPITFKNVPSNLTITQSMQQITILAKGDSDKLDASLMTATADLANLSAGEHEVNLDITTPGSVNVLQAYKIHITLQ